ncbi:hypothetical protein AB0I54_03740 [Streptomyces sp. NPDC050625]|uniref:hypothetical protein n=1 Tax=Streptomyces sp. NPDC050625 TaxID=3154629 RepID=UPI00342BA0F4
MIKPESIPLFTGNLGQLEHHVQALRHEADGIRQGGDAAHRQFQGLSAFYQAPEAEELFASTAPARDAADTFADKVATVADALSTYAAEVAPIAKRLEALHSRAAAFVAGLRTDSGTFDENWNHDPDKVDEHHALMHEVNVAQHAFAAAEIACSNKITSLVGGTQYVMHTGDTQFIPRGAELYGYSAEMLDQAKELPWGTPESQSHNWWDPHDFNYYFKSFVWDGLLVDNVWGTVDGLSSLVGANGSQDFKDSWTGLVRVVVGAETYLMESGGQKPTGVFASDFAQGSKVYAKEFAKSFVAWDKWKENPARASATVLFNALTLGAGPLKAASAGRAGTAAKAAATVAKVGDAIDPINATVKVTGHAIPKIAEVTANLRGMNNIPDVRVPHSVLELSDGSKLLVEDGKFIRLDNSDRPLSDIPPRELSADDRGAGAVPARDGDLVGAGAGSRTPEATARLGSEDAGVPRSTGQEMAAGGEGGTPSPHHPAASGHSAGRGSDSEGAHHGLESGDTHTSGGGHGDTGHTDTTADWGEASDPEGTHSDHESGGSHGSIDAGPLELGGEAERRLREGIKGIPRNTIKPKVVEKIVSRLSEDPSGREIADIISSGHLSQMPGYKDVVAMLGSGIQSHFPSAVDQIRLAEQFHQSGVHDIAFEIKNPSIKADIDVKVTDDAGRTYGYQMKRLNNPKNPFDSITKADNLGQLSKSVADNKIMLVDGQGTISEWEARGIFDELLQVHHGEHPFKSEKGRGILFVLRLDDGTVVIPPGSKVDPRGVL